MSVRMSVRMKQLRASTGRIFVKLGFNIFFFFSVEKIEISLQSDNNNSTLHEDRYTFFDHIYLILS
jgi:hypothetical protein